jgi:hypothetical protein
MVARKGKQGGREWERERERERAWEREREREVGLKDEGREQDTSSALSLDTGMCDCQVFNHLLQDV